MDRTYICIDLKSYYASVECVHRGLDPLRANLLVADPSRSDQTICLAVSPSLKAMGVPGRPRLFEAKQAIRMYEAQHHTKVEYIIAVPRMAEYERISAKIYGIYLRYVAPEDVHVYSIDECFIDCTGYLHMYLEEAKRTATNPAHIMAMTMIRDVLKTTGITATVGIGTNMYLAKVAMDIVAKKRPADKDGVRIAELNEDSYKFLLWDHTPLTDFWRIGNGTAARLANLGIHTMGDLARRSLSSEELLYKTFGVDAEILIDHAWGVEPCTIAHIKNYRSSAKSLGTGQVLSCPYPRDKARLVVQEMAESLAQELFSRQLAACDFTLYVCYDRSSLDDGYDGETEADRYGREVPKADHGTVHVGLPTASMQKVTRAVLSVFDRIYSGPLLARRLNLTADNVVPQAQEQADLFTDAAAQEKDARLSGSIDSINRSFGRGTVRFGIQGDGRILNNSDHQSPHYTTLWSDLPRASIK